MGLDIETLDTQITLDRRDARRSAAFKSPADDTSRHVNPSGPYRRTLVKREFRCRRGAVTTTNPGDVMTRADGLQIARAGRMMLALAEYFNDHRFARAAEDAWHLGLMTPASARHYLDTIRRPGRRGVGRFDRWLARAAEA